MFEIPTLKALSERARQSFRANLKGSDAWVWPNNVYVAAKVKAGLAYEIFGFANYIFRQRFALLADSENLDLHGAEFGLSRRPSAPSKGEVTVTADDAIAVGVAAIFRRADGVQYRAVNGGSLTGAGVLDLDVVSTSDGPETTAIAGTPLEIVSGVSGTSVATAAVAPGGLVGGAGIEDDEAFRARILFRKRYPVMGGAASDYVQWCGEVSGVSSDGTRPTVFVERIWAGPGTVRVFPLMFDLYQDGIPQAADVARVADFLQSVQPAGAVVTVAAPTAKPVDITISGLSPDRADIREAIASELRAAFRRQSRVSGSDANIPNMQFLAYPTSLSASWIWQAVANASGEERHTITAPAGDVPLASGEMATLGTIAYV